MAEKDYFLVKANKDDTSFIINAESQEVTITKGKIYKAYDYHASPFYVICKNDINLSRKHLVSIFDKLNFGDIWELKRNGRTLPN